VEVVSARQTIVRVLFCRACPAVKQRSRQLKLEPVVQVYGSPPRRGHPVEMYARTYDLICSAREVAVTCRRTRFTFARTLVKYISTWMSSAGLRTWGNRVTSSRDVVCGYVCLFGTCQQFLTRCSVVRCEVVLHAVWELDIHCLQNLILQ